MLANFHFIRPWWWLTLLPAVCLIYLNWRHQRRSRKSWSAFCDPQLVPYVVEDSLAKPSRGLVPLLGFIWLVLIIALAGPSWSRYPAAVYQKKLARVIVLDVSDSMNNPDLSPSRLQRAKYKILDYLKDLHEGQIGMVVFSSSAFVVSPLTNDAQTVANLVPVLDSQVVPVQGSDLNSGLQKAAQLLRQAGTSQGEIILVTDSSPDTRAENSVHKLAQDGYRTNVLALAPTGSTSQIDRAALRQLAAQGGGSYFDFSADNSDVQALLALGSLDSAADLSQPTEQSRSETLWKDQGQYLIWLALILVAILARKGYLEKLC